MFSTPSFGPCWTRGDILDGGAPIGVGAGGALVATDPLPGLPQHTWPSDPVVQSVEAPLTVPPRGHDIYHRVAMADSTGPTYERFPSSPGLARFVEHFWTLSAPGQNGPKREILIPNGRPLLLLSFATPSTRIDPITGERSASSNALSGVTTKPFVIEQPGDACYVGAQLRPYGLARLFPSARLVNQVMSIEHWLGKSHAAHLRESLLACEVGRARVEALDTFLQRVLARTDLAHLPAMEPAIDRIQTEGGQINVDELASQLNVTYMTLYRMFKRLVGVGPKKFADIIRYYIFVGSMLGNNQHDSMSSVASLQGYYDQAHASKEFKKFTGVTQSTFRTTLNGIALLMHQP